MESHVGLEIGYFLSTGSFRGWVSSRENQLGPGGARLDSQGV